MPDEVLSRDQNHITVLGGVTDDSNQDIIMLRVDPITKRLLISAIVSVTADLTVGTSTITGGSNGKILYNNNGIVGELTNNFLTSLNGAVLVSQATPQAIGDTTNRLLKLWATDITCTNAIVASITGSAPTLTTTRAIYGNNFDGSAALTQVIASTYGGTGNGFTKFTGPTTAEKTFTLPDANATLVDLAVVQTLTNKRITKRVASTTDDATAVIDSDSYDEYYLTAIANATEISITGTPTNGQTIFIGLKDAGVTKNLTWTGITGLGQTLPAATTAGKQHIIGIKYIASAWRAIAVSVEA